MSEAQSEIITIFRNRLAEGAEHEYGNLAPHIASLASDMPGLINFKTFTASDGERVTIVTFENKDTHDAWRDHPEHVAARARGIEELYNTYSIQVGTVSYSHHFAR